MTRKPKKTDPNDPALDTGPAASRQQSQRDQRALPAATCQGWAQSAVPPGCECPECQEWQPNLLVWIDDDHVRCDSCDAIYNPTTRKVAGSADDACLGCGEVRPSMLEWFEDGRVRCRTCGTIYNPGTGEVHSRGQVQPKGGGDASGN